ncbi:MAG: peptidoglycan editing factor PgeF [Pseudomonadota bacterium]
MDQLTPVQASMLVALDGVRHAFFTRGGGVSKGVYEGLNAGLGSGDERSDVVENRARMARYLDIAQPDIASPYQVHSPDCVATDVAWLNDRPKADGIVTTTPKNAVGIVTADCGPVLFADAENRVVGAAHAGWKGALTGVLENTIAKMEAEGAQRAKIKAVLGPMISARNYEVGPGFDAPFVELDGGNSRFFKPSVKPGHHMFDLAGYIVDRLQKAGVEAENLDICTYAAEDDFYSYRRTTHRKEPDYGRQMSAIVLE